MTYRNPFKKTVLIFTVVFTGCSIVLSVPKKNIVLIMADDIAYDNNFGAYGAHSPMIVRLPNTIPAGTRCIDIIDLSDVLPTLAEITNVELPEVKLDGRSFWPHCKGEPGNPRDWIYQYFWPEIEDKVPAELGTDDIIWVHNQHYKLHGNGLFYDIVNDREELSPIPLEQLTGEQKEAFTMFKAAIASMPEANPAYQKTTITKQSNKSWG
jgi:arylsulfatase A-like enzyme